MAPWFSLRFKQHLKLCALGVLLCICILATYLAIRVTRFHQAFVLPESQALILEIPSDASLADVKKSLQAFGILPDPWMFDSLAWYHQWHRILKAGDYEITSGMSIDDVMCRIKKNQQYLYKLTLIEGVTAEEALAVIRHHPKVQDDLAGVDIHALLAWPHASMEGTLFPSTYKFCRDTKASVLVQKSHHDLRDMLAKGWAKRTDGWLKDPYDALVLASIIEKESGRSSERAMISSVFYNRLKKSMLLQTDPTVRYAFAVPRGQPLTKAQLKTKHPYNTYTTKGLPPGPIRLPSRESLNAAVNPDPSNFLYFVLQPDGAHQFSSTLVEHQRAVQKLRIFQAQSKSKGSP